MVNNERQTMQTNERFNSFEDLGSRINKAHQREQDIEKLQKQVTDQHSVKDAIRIFMSQDRTFDSQEVFIVVSKVKSDDVEFINGDFRKMVNDGYFHHHLGDFYSLKKHKYYNAIEAMNSNTTGTRSTPADSYEAGTNVDTVYAAFELYEARGASIFTVHKECLSNDLESLSVRSAVSNLCKRKHNKLYDLGTKLDKDGNYRKFYSTKEPGKVQQVAPQIVVPATSQAPEMDIIQFPLNVVEPQIVVKPEQKADNKKAATSLLQAMKDTQIALGNMKAVAEIMKKENVDAETACAMFFMS
jgi:hypothetical protein